MKKYDEIYLLCFGSEAFFEGDIQLHKLRVLAHLEPAERKAFMILEDLMDRRGFRQNWDQIDDEFKEEIYTTVRDIIAGT
jgi:hypothetical protein